MEEKKGERERKQLRGNKRKKQRREEERKKRKKRREGGLKKERGRKLAPPVTGGLHCPSNPCNDCAPYPVTSSFSSTPFPWVKSSLTQLSSIWWSQQNIHLNSILLSWASDLHIYLSTRIYTKIATNISNLTCQKSILLQFCPNGTLFLHFSHCGKRKQKQLLPKQEPRHYL